MVSRRAYKRVSVNALDQEVLAQIAAREMVAVLGLDIAKNEIVACVRWKSSEFERPWNIVNPYGIKDLVKLCSTLIDRGLTLSGAMESTGTYGESVRRAYTLAKISVLRVSGKHVSDYKEVSRYERPPRLSLPAWKDAYANHCDCNKFVPLPKSVATQFSRVNTQFCKW